jgi:4-diphosphocytidyl-2-C-methyl-D-erythritol kinase
MPQNLHFSSPAKINLFLRVGDKLANGYHQVTTVMTKISLADEITLTWSKKRSLTLTCSHPDVPLNQDNLLYRTFKLLQTHFHLPTPKIHLNKKIPLAAGLGGGSSNAGYLLKTLNHHLNLGLGKKQLQRLALQLGADVPFAVSQADCVSETNHGLSTLKQTTLPSLPACKITLSFQNFHLKTPQMYQQITHYRFPPTSSRSLVTALKTQSLTDIGTHLNNDFSHCVFHHYPKLLTLKKKLLQAGAAGVGLSGKGPTLFALFPLHAHPPKSLYHLMIYA